MILDILERSMLERSPLIPVEALLNRCEGGRMPDVNPAFLTPELARRVSEICPTAAFTMDEANSELRLSYGECIGCGRCVDVGESAVFNARVFPWTGLPKQHIVRTWNINDQAETTAALPSPEASRKEIHALFGRALNIRQLDPGSCNGCEAEIIALTNPHYDLERFGIHFVASPKHADMLLVTGPVTRNMAEATRLTYQATPAPKLVVAVGACGCSGGVFAESHAIAGPVDAVLPVDAYIPGCPPTPAMLLNGILNALRQRISKKSAAHSE